MHRVVRRKSLYGQCDSRNNWEFHNRQHRFCLSCRLAFCRTNQYRVAWPVSWTLHLTTETVAVRWKMRARSLRFECLCARKCNVENMWSSECSAWNMGALLSSLCRVDQCVLVCAIAQNWVHLNFHRVNTLHRPVKIKQSENEISKL